MCVLVYVIYEDTHLYNDMGITLVLQCKRGLGGEFLSPRN